MRKRNLAMWPIAVLRQRVAEIVVQVPEPEQWVQEQEKLRNHRREVESAQEMFQRLAPGYDVKRLIL